MNTLNWRIRKTSDANDAFFFIEADLPDAEKNGYYPRLEVMQEDYGDHNGYTHEIRLADAKLIAAAPNLLKACIKALKEIQNPKRDGTLAEEDLINAIKKATEI